MAEDLRKYRGDGVFFDHEVGSPAILNLALEKNYASRDLAIPTSFFEEMGWNERIDSSDFNKAVQQAKSIILGEVKHLAVVLPQHRKRGQIWQPVAALEEKRGSCQHKSALIAGLLRSAGIPARVVFHRDFYGQIQPHFWVEAFDEKHRVWSPVDTAPAKKEVFIVRGGKAVKLDERVASRLRQKGLVREHEELFSEKSGERLECFEHKTRLRFKGETSVRRYK